MEHTYTSPEDARAAGLAQGYGQMLGFPVPRNQPHLEFDLPAGFIMSTAEDMAHYLIAQLNGGRYDQVRVLSPSGIEAMHRPPTEVNSPYGMGWEEKTIDGIPIIAHSGSLETFYARVILMPEQDYGLVVLINQNGLLNLLAYEKMTENIVRLLAGIETLAGISLIQIYLAITAIILLDLGRHGMAFRQLARGRGKGAGKTPGQVWSGIAAQIILPLVILFGLPALLLTTLGSKATRVLILYYLPGVALWVVISATLTFLRGLIKIWMLREDAHAG